MKSSKDLLRVPGVLVACLSTTLAAWAAAGPEPAEFGWLDIDQLSRVKVITASRGLESVWDTPAAIQAITQEDIRRSGATSLPQALRLAPGMEVAQSTARSSAVSARGFNDVLADKLLVLIDGRSVYDPFQAGVRWQYQDVVMEDIDRIEVIRGPGGTSWGANAVNGIVNVISKSAKETPGWLVSGLAGSQPSGDASVRYGAVLGEGLWGRVYGKYRASDDTETSAGGRGFDAWSSWQGGFRVDWEASSDSQFTLQGDVQYLEGDAEATDVLLVPVGGSYKANYLDQVHRRGANVLGRWKRVLGVDSDFTLQTYYDHFSDSVSQFQQRAGTFDVDAVWRAPVWSKLSLTAGLGYRVVDDEFIGSWVTYYEPAEFTRHIYSAFLQGEVALVEDRLTLTLGSKVEHNPFTGVEFQPSARLLWKPAEAHAVWAGVTRAVRTGYRDYQALRVNAAVFPTSPANPGFPVSVIRVGATGAEVDAEETVALELGHRWRVLDRVVVDVATFYNIHNEMVGFVRQPGTVPELTPAPPHLLIVSRPENVLDGESFGLEAAVTYQVTDGLRVSATYNALDVQMHRIRGPASLESREFNSPSHQAGLRVSGELGECFEWDAWVRRVDEVAGIPTYWTLDVRFGWHPARNVELALIGQSLLDANHPEWRSLSAFGNSQREVPRTVQGRLTLRF